VPRKIRQLAADLKRAKFVLLPHRGKGSHRIFKHVASGTEVTLSGHIGDDADHYQEHDVREAIAEARHFEQEREA
jgi:predicted RNA binding protein YcfA (HicA-like mRNA interferase family)